MKNSWPFLFVVGTWIPFGCGMFNDEFKIGAPAPVTTVFRYPGVAELTIRSISEGQSTKNKLIVLNAGSVDINAAEIVLKTFKLDNKNFENLVRVDHLKTIKLIKPGAADTIPLPDTQDYYRYRSQITAALTKVTGIDNFPLAGYYRGSYTTYKGGVKVFGGNVNAVIDIHGSMLAQAKAPNEFTVVEGTVSPDSVAYLALQVDNTIVKRLQAPILPGVSNTLTITYLISTNGADSTLTILKKQN